MLLCHCFLFRLLYVCSIPFCLYNRTQKKHSLLNIKSIKTVCGDYRIPTHIVNSVVWYDLDDVLYLTKNSRIISQKLRNILCVMICSRKCGNIRSIHWAAFVFFLWWLRFGSRKTFLSNHMVAFIQFERYNREPLPYTQTHTHLQKNRTYISEHSVCHVGLKTLD